MQIRLFVFLSLSHTFVDILFLVFSLYVMFICAYMQADIVQCKYLVTSELANGVVAGGRGQLLPTLNFSLPENFLLVEKKCRLKYKIWH